MILWPSMTELFATGSFAFAIFHTFSVKRFRLLAHQYAPGSAGENFFHLLGEVEIVFGFWAAILLIFIAATQGSQEVIRYLETRNFTEPVFVFVIMTVCATRPILVLAGYLIDVVSRILPLKKPIAFYATSLILGPLIGSFITEPAAMTVTALILLERFFKKGLSQKWMYATLGLLFVNISIGGTVTPYAAPPVLMVAKVWGWDLSFMVKNFGWKAAVSILVGTIATTAYFRKELGRVSWDTKSSQIAEPVPFWILGAHLAALALVVLTSHYITVFVSIFLFFLGLVSITKEHQEELKLREGLLVAFFLGGLVVLGGFQKWWLEFILIKLNSFVLFLGSASLSSITDNAALTYLGSQVSTLSEGSKYSLVAGAIAGGGLTVIANAPNPAGYGILNLAFGKDGISPLLLFLYALPPTLLALLAFWFL